MARDATIILRHLPYFLAVVEEGSLQAAAARLNTTQSAISRRIRLLEFEIGDVPLFERSARGMRLLPAGEALLTETRTVLAAIGRAKAQIDAIASGVAGRVTVGFAEILGRRGDMLEAIRDFARDHPTLDVQMKPLVSEEQRGELAAGTIDLGLLYHPMDEDIVATLSGNGQDFASVAILDDPFLLAVPAAHHLATKEDLRLADLGDEPIIWASHKKNPRLYDLLQEACDRRGFSPRIAMETPTSDITMKIVTAAMGIGFVPASLIGHAPPEVAFVRPIDFDVAMRASLVWRTAPDGDLPGRVAQHFLDRVPHF